MQSTDHQVRRLMTEFKKAGKVGLAAMKAGMDRKTAGKYLKLGKFPSELKKPRTWLTRADFFEEDWPDIREILQDVPEIEAVVVLDHLIGLNSDRYQESHLRTLQRRIKRWRAEEGPPKRVFFPQDHRPGEGHADGFHDEKPPRGNDLQRSLRAPAVPSSAPLLELGMDYRLPVGVHCGLKRGV